MRIVSTLFVFTVLATLAGCGASEPVAPTQVSAEEERQLQEEQKKVDAEEQQQATQGRAQELSPEQQVEMQERARQNR